jgi:hypothetical protein
MICKEMKPVLLTYWKFFLSKWLMTKAKKNISLIQIIFLETGGEFFFFFFVNEMNKNLVIF